MSPVSTGRKEMIGKWSSLCYMVPSDFLFIEQLLLCARHHGGSWVKNHTLSLNLSLPKETVSFNPQNNSVKIR
jgi:hypothetical protein